MFLNKSRVCDSVSESDVRVIGFNFDFTNYINSGDSNCGRENEQAPKETIEKAGEQ